MGAEFFFLVALIPLLFPPSSNYNCHMHSTDILFDGVNDMFFITLQQHQLLLDECPCKVSIRLLMQWHKPQEHQDEIRIKNHVHCNNCFDNIAAHTHNALVRQLRRVSVAQ